MYCQKCGSQIPEHAAFCRHCGAKQGIASELEPKNPVIKRESGRKTGKKSKRRKKSPMKAVVVIGIIILVLTGVTTCFFFFESELLKRGNGSEVESSVERASINKKVSDETEVVSHSDQSEEQNAGVVATTAPEYVDIYIAKDSDHGTVLLFPMKDDDSIEIEDGGYFNGQQLNMDGSVHLVSTWSGDLNIPGGNLYVLRDGNADIIGNNVDGSYLSAYGDAIAYSVASAEFETAKLYLYYKNRNEQVLLTDNFTKNAVFSPHGDVLLFTEADGYRYTLKCYDGKNITTLVENYSGGLSPVAITDDANLIWYASSEGYDDVGLYSFNGVSSTRIGDIFLGREVYLNADCTEIIFSDGTDGFICLNGKEAIKIEGNDDLAMLRPPLERKTYLWHYPIAEQDSSGNSTRICDVGTFQGSFLICGSIIYGIDNGSVFETSIRDVSGVHYKTNGRVSADQKSVVYLKEAAGGIFYATLDGTQNRMLTSESVSWFATSSDCSVVCYVTENGDLFYQKDKKEPVRVSGALGVDPLTNRIEEQKYSSAFAYDDTTKNLYYVEGAKLYVSNDGGAGTVVSGIEGDAYAISKNALGLMVVARGATSDYLYRSTDGETFSFVSGVLEKDSY